MYGFSSLASHLILYPFQAVISVLDFKISIPFSVISSISEVNVKIGNSSISFHASFLYLESWKHLFTGITLKMVSHLSKWRFQFFVHCWKTVLYLKSTHPCCTSNSLGFDFTYCAPSGCKEDSKNMSFGLFLFERKEGRGNLGRWPTYSAEPLKWEKKRV